MMKHILRTFWVIPFVVIALSTLVSIGVSVSQTPQYRSTVNLLVIQRQGTSLDAFSASRSAETIASLLSKIVYSTSFYDQLDDAGYGLVDIFTTENSAETKKKWEKAVDARATSNGSLEIDVYHPNRDGAEAYALAIAHVLVNDGSEYHGGGSSVEIKMVDRPSTTLKPATPLIFQNVLLGFVGGVVVSISILMVIYFYQQRKLALEKPVSFYRDDEFAESRSGFVADDDSQGYDEFNEAIDEAVDNFEKDE